MDLKKWLKIALVNILIVAALGVILRYKIAFSLPFIEQKKILHAHSHFAFGGWVSQALMALIVFRLSVHSGIELFKRYNWLLWANLICSYGMLAGFIVQGYGFFSILFSTSALFVSYIFMFFVWRDINRCPQKNISFKWFKAATFFNSLSSLGAFALAYMMATKNVHQDWYLGAVYFFLHFQYNGWFSFTVLGLLSEKLQEANTSYNSLRSIYRLFVFACVPAYFLSALWLPIPDVVYILVVVSAILQAIGWIWLMRLVKKVQLYLKNSLSKLPYIIILLSLVAFSIKFVLQLGSTVPMLSNIAFGFRPIVIGYLHLVLLGCISLFLIGYTIYLGVIETSIQYKIALAVFVAGIILNELVLMVQGFAAMNYISVPYINEMLFCVAIIIFTGLVILNIRLKKTNSIVTHIPNTSAIANV
ncbi:MAG: hypothetical protein K0Q79_871 [Flavipsychrobacter sp.]|jgi:hypothetical protein|nr:hypothetical protein [Flavipsychrobacter sp.]